MGKIKRIAGTDERPLVVGIPDVVRIVVVAVEPLIGIIAFHVEHLQIAVRIANI
ncbi:MAG: hypothetical protein NTW46_03435 [Candidatus Nealsonbacteria bacterium]|nr:hypothetical protein [Candidatus Nealsonbacteria bacterium]